MAGGGVNKVILIGRLGQDPEIRYTPSGGAVANVTLATSEQWKDKQSGDKQERTEWHRVVFFNRLAEIVGEYLKKGSQVYVEGRLQTRKWQDKEGNDRYTTEIVAGEMQMLDSRGSGSSGSSSADYNQDRDNSSRDSSSSRDNNAPRREERPAAPAADDFDDDIPF